MRSMKKVNLTVVFTALVPDDVDHTRLCMHIPYGMKVMQMEAVVMGRAEVKPQRVISVNTTHVELVENGANVSCRL